MKKQTLAFLLAICMVVGMLAACGAPEAAPVEEPVSESTASVAPEEPTPAEAPVPEEPAASVAEEPEESAVEEASDVEEPTEVLQPATCTVTFSDGQTFEATVGEDFVFFFQCDAPGDMGAPAEGEEGAGITVSDGTVTYSNVGLGGPYSYPTSELVTISGFTGDFTVTIAEEATFMDATYTIYTDEDEIAEAIAFAEAMAAQQAANPIP